MRTCWPNSFICFRDHEKNNNLNQKQPCSYKLWPKKYLFIPKYTDDLNIILLWALMFLQNKTFPLRLGNKVHFSFYFDRWHHSQNSRDWDKRLSKQWLKTTGEFATEICVCKVSLSNLMFLQKQSTKIWALFQNWHVSG